MGARPKLETKHAKVTRIALEEVDANAVSWQLAPVEPLPADIPMVDPLPTENA